MSSCYPDVGVRVGDGRDCDAGIRISITEGTVSTKTDKLNLLGSIRWNGTREHFCSQPRSITRRVRRVIGWSDDNIVPG